MKINEEIDINGIWNKLKESLDEIVAEEICGKEQSQKKQNWINSDILHKMEERRICKNMNEEEKYKKLKHEIQKLCREAKDKYYDEKCKEIEMLDNAHTNCFIKELKSYNPKEIE